MKAGQSMLPAEDARAEPGVKPCAGCGAAGAALLGVEDGYRIVRCASCGLTYLDLQPTASDLEEFYSEDYFKGGADRKAYIDYEGDRALVLRSFRPKLARLERLQRPGAILDVGCATGLFLEAARSRGWTPFGLEVSPYAGAVARDRLGDCVFASMSELPAGPGSLRAVTMWDSIEHLPEPAQTLQEINRLLVPGGVLGLCTGDIDSWLARIQGMSSRIYNPPQHLYFFSRATLGTMLERCGFEVVERRRDGKWMSLAYFAHVISLTDPGPLTRLLGRAAHMPRLGKLPLWLPLPDNMQIYARKVGPGSSPP